MTLFWIGVIVTTHGVGLAIIVAMLNAIDRLHEALSASTDDAAPGTHAGLVP